MKEKIPKEQAAYQPGRSTTEQVFTMKILAEKSITSEDFPIYLLMLDMSKAFDSIDRNTLLKHLSTFLEKSEIYLMHLLINDIIFKVKLGEQIGTDIHTNVGTCQGDCLSAIFFILYLAKAMEKIPETPEEQDCEKPLWSCLDWLVESDVNNININTQYSDDINFLRSNKSKINLLKRRIPDILKEYKLEVNINKTEEYHIENDENILWKNCKCLGSYIDTETDIKKRQGIATSAFQSLEKIFKSNNISLETKLRNFDAYVGNLFLYNSEIWTTNENINNKIDVIHRKFLRRILGVTWPKVISNEHLYNITKRAKWSQIIRKKAFSWLGHLLRLNPETPARKSLEEYLKPTKRRPGRPKNTWVSMIKKSIITNKIDINTTSDIDMFKQLETIAAERKNWSTLFGSVKL